MARLNHLMCVVLLTSALAGCAGATTPPTATPEAAAGASQGRVTIPPSEPGPYGVGTTTFDAVDASRGKRQVSVTVWYPVKPPQGSQGDKPPVVADGVPDRDGAPYPLIVSSATVGRLLAPHVVAHGFAWAGVNKIDSYGSMSLEMISQPLDILFALSQVASKPPKSLKGIIDADHAGAIGYSFDGYNALAMSGARIDPAYYLAQCPEPDATTRSLNLGLSAFACQPATEWDEFVKGAGKAVTASRDGLWQPMTDKRIRAVMPMAGEGWWLFGERGLAAANRPTLMLVATEDELYRENVLIYDHLGTPDKTLISVVGKDHYMVFDAKMSARMASFAVAFFGYHLRGDKALAYYVSEQYVAQQADLAWGVYQKK